MKPLLKKITEIINMWIHSLQTINKNDEITAASLSIMKDLVHGLEPYRIY